MIVPINYIKIQTSFCLVTATCSLLYFLNYTLLFVFFYCSRNSQNWVTVTSDSS